MDMNKMMKQVQRMQADLAKAQEELAEQEIEGQAGNGLVKVTVTGGGEFNAIAIDPKAIDPDDPSLLEDLVLAAIRDALSRQQALAQDRLAPLTGGLGLPGL